MNKCEIIRDLFPIYIDDCCSESSKIFVEEHLRECEECKRIYEELNTDISIKNDYTVPDQSEEFYFKKGKEIIADEIKKDYVLVVSIIDFIMNVIIFIVGLNFINKFDYINPVTLFFMIICMAYDIIYIFQYRKKSTGNIIRAAVLSEFLLKLVVIMLGLLILPIMY